MGVDDPLVSEFDPVAGAGARTPTWVSATVDADGSGLELRFDAETGTPLLNALRVERR